MSSFDYLTLPKGVIGFGTMRTTWTPTPNTEEEAVEIFHTAYEAGARFFNGGEFYGEKNLEYLRAFFDKYPELKDEIIVSIKGGINFKTFQPDGSREGIDKSLGGSLQRLPKIDIFECARVDKNTPIEETLGYIKEYVKAGKIRGISLSEASAATIRRAAKVVKVAFVELEFSLWEREILDNGIVATCAELGIPVVAYSPLGAGFLTGTIGDAKDFPEGDFRASFDRFQEENIKQNKILLAELKKIADKAGLSLPQLSLAWIKFFNSDKFADSAKYPEFIPIPGSTKLDRVRDNAHIRELTPEIFEEIQTALEKHKVAGIRYNAQMQEHLLG